MEKIVIVLATVLVLSCSPSKKHDSETTADNVPVSQTEHFDWLLGQWKRLNEEEGKETVENWEKISETEYAGIGFTMQNGDTIKQEKIRLFKADQNWNVVVKVPEETESVTFLGTRHSTNEFIVENKEIDFPNTIRYWKDGEHLKASVSNTEMEILFEFTKLDK